MQLFRCDPRLALNIIITELHDHAQDTKGTIKQETKKHATCFATLLQNELNSDVARFTTNKIKPCNLIYLLSDSFERGL